jgi:hypothetical protein
MSRYHLQQSCLLLQKVSPFETQHFTNYHHRLGHTRTALIFLEKALELEGFMEDSSFKADTHLNISAVLS